MNYYTQILHGWNWKQIDDLMDQTAAEYREWLADSTIEDKDKEDGYNAHNMWAGIPTDWEHEDAFAVMLYIGSQLNIFPSGKFYMLWSTNVTEKEADKDEAYRYAFDKVTAKYNCSLTNGEGSAEDMFLVRSYEFNA